LPSLQKVAWECLVALSEEQDSLTSQFENFIPELLQHLKSHLQTLVA
jgi:hypothetical protein